MRAARVSFGVVLALGGLGIVSLLQGVVDVGLPMSRGETPFAFTFALMERLGPGVLFLSILVHNLGLAGLLPGVGFLAAMLEPNARMRAWIPRILFAALLVSMASAFTFMFVGSGHFDLRFSLPLFLAEATAVVGVALMAYDQFSRFHERPAPVPHIAAAFEAIMPAFFAAALGLIALATLETLTLLGA